MLVRVCPCRPRQGHTLPPLFVEPHPPEDLKTCSSLVIRRGLNRRGAAPFMETGRRLPAAAMSVGRAMPSRVRDYKRSFVIRRFGYRLPPNNGAERPLVLPAQRQQRPGLVFFGQLVQGRMKSRQSKSSLRASGRWSTTMSISRGRAPTLTKESTW